jgi:hypothetical protein
MILICRSNLPNITEHLDPLDESIKQNQRTNESLVKEKKLLESERPLEKPSLIACGPQAFSMGATNFMADPMICPREILPLRVGNDFLDTSLSRSSICERESSESAFIPSSPKPYINLVPSSFIPNLPHSTDIELQMLHRQQRFQFWGDSAESLEEFAVTQEVSHYN